MLTDLHTDPSVWRPASSEASHPLARLDWAEVGSGVRLSVEFGPRNRAGALRFRGFLESDEFGRTMLPAIVGLGNDGPLASQRWIEVTHTLEQLPLSDGRSVDVPDGIALRIVEALAQPIPAGGHLLLEYDSAARRTTARALAAGVPPVATPLGGMLFAAGCGAVVRNRATGGGLAGPRRLVGVRPVDRRHREQRGREMLDELEAFMRRAPELDWMIQSQTRPIAEATIAALRSQLGRQGAIVPLN